MTIHHFHLTAEWPGGRNDIGTIHSGNLQTQISIPTGMEGPGIGTNPDEMLLGAASTCYIITFAAMLERAHIEKARLSMQSEALVDVTNGVFTYKKIIHCPELVLVPGTSEKVVEKARKLAEKAETSCMISKAIKGNVAVELNATISIAQ
ncbi:peroxiredoxin, SACOL1771 subfamily [Peribacillus simplex]|uniref:Peroxiredoxin, SACOL1771 subfamily n=1 Tax=Peribacillus simplex TaxID=1478 RepID=A0A9X8RBP9_9BACI|nr:OsmC family protein [Peribacillus simplex]SIR77872.1 peroxiredoxin, SACOL1771 subfamily [Peribacillus simplex]